MAGSAGLTAASEVKSSTVQTVNALALKLQNVLKQMINIFTIIPNSCQILMLHVKVKGNKMIVSCGKSECNQNYSFP